MLSRKKTTADRSWTVPLLCSVFLCACNVVDFFSAQNQNLIRTRCWAEKNYRWPFLDSSFVVLGLSLRLWCCRFFFCSGSESDQNPMLSRKKTTADRFCTVPLLSLVFLCACNVVDFFSAQNQNLIRTRCWAEKNYRWPFLDSSFVVLSFSLCLWCCRSSVLFSHGFFPISISSGVFVKLLFVTVAFPV